MACKKIVQLFLIVYFNISCTPIPIVSESDDWAPRFSGERDFLNQIETLKDNLASAQHDRIIAEQKALYLNEQLIHAQIRFIRNRVYWESRRISLMKKNSATFQDYQKIDLSTFYLNEREALVKIIDEKEALQQEAQEILDEVLKMITELNTKLEER